MIIDEPLRESAPLARRWASECCPQALLPWSCQTYHGMWQYYRATGLKRSVELDTRALLPLFRDALIGLRSPRILVAAAADYALLARLLAVCRALGCAPHITVIDTCETPLRLNAWYGARHGVAIDVVKGDIFSWLPEQPFDLVCTHGFVTMLPLELRPELMACWRRLCRIGGHLVTANRVVPDDGSAVSNAPAAALVAPAGPEESLAALVDRCRQQLALADLDDSEGQWVLDSLPDYVANKDFHPLPRQGDLLAMLARSGFDVVASDNPSPAESAADFWLAQRPVNASRVGKGTRLRVLARAC